MKDCKNHTKSSKEHRNVLYGLEFLEDLERYNRNANHQYRGEYVLVAYTLCPLNSKGEGSREPRNIEEADFHIFKQYHPRTKTKGCPWCKRYLKEKVKYIDRESKIMREYWWQDLLTVR